MDKAIPLYPHQQEYLKMLMDAKNSGKRLIIMSGRCYGKNFIKDVLESEDTEAEVLESKINKSK